MVTLLTSADTGKYPWCKVLSFFVCLSLAELWCLAGAFRWAERCETVPKLHALVEALIGEGVLVMMWTCAAIKALSVKFCIYFQVHTHPHPSRLLSLARPMYLLKVMKTWLNLKRCKFSDFRTKTTGSCWTPWNCLEFRGGSTKRM